MRLCPGNLPPWSSSLASGCPRRSVSILKNASRVLAIDTFVPALHSPGLSPNGQSMSPSIAWSGECRDISVIKVMMLVLIYYRLGSRLFVAIKRTKYLEALRRSDKRARELRAGTRTLRCCRRRICCLQWTVMLECIHERVETIQ